MKGIEIILLPDKRQIDLLQASVETYVDAWNWGLKRKQQSFIEDGASIKYRDLILAFRQSGYRHNGRVSSVLPQQALWGLERAYFKATHGESKRYPRPLTIEKGAAIFVGDYLRYSATHIYLPKIGRVEYRGSLPKDGTVRKLVVTLKEDRWKTGVYLREETQASQPPVPEVSPPVDVDQPTDAPAVQQGPVTLSWKDIIRDPLEAALGDNDVERWLLYTIAFQLALERVYGLQRGEKDTDAGPMPLYTGKGKRIMVAPVMLGGIAADVVTINEEGKFLNGRSVDKIETILTDLGFPLEVEMAA